MVEGGEGSGPGGGQQGAVVGGVAGEQAPRRAPDALPPEAALDAVRDPEEGMEQAEHVVRGREEERGRQGGHWLPTAGTPLMRWFLCSDGVKRSRALTIEQEAMFFTFLRYITSS
jgi:hypothetical protein